MLARAGASMFGVSGRLGRLAWWLRLIATTLVSAAIFSVAAYVEPYSGSAFLILAGVSGVIALAAWISLAIRRFHDHGRKGWQGAGVVTLAAAIAFAGGKGLVWTPVATLAGVVSLALFAYLGFVRGIRGPNEYGPDPLTD